MPKEYIGDGVYADVEDGDLILTTENGATVSNRIVLEPDVLQTLERYVATHRARSTG